MALATGTYDVVMHYAKKHRADQRFYTLDFSIADTGERERAIVLYKDMSAIFPAAYFIMREGCIWSPYAPDDPQPVIALALEFSQKYGSTRAVSASRTGKTLACDIKAPVKLTYEDF